MNAIRKLSPIAIAVAALVAAPLALATASVRDGQFSYGNHQESSFNATGEAVLSGNAGKNTSGNLGFNIATGSQNQQANAGALSSNSNIDDAAASSAAINADQLELMDWACQWVNGANAVEFTGNALRNASGNIGVNLTSGIFNQQSNNMAASHAAHSDYASASVDTDQFSVLNYASSGLNGGYYYEDYASNSTGLYGHVLVGAGGNIGVNEAAGISNQQSNSLAIATAANSDSEGYAIGATANVNATQVLGGNGSTQGSYDYSYDSQSGPWYGFDDNFFNTTNVAGLGSDALKNASGNIGVNMASGTNNQQSNSLALSSTKNTYRSQKSTDFADATAGANQVAGANYTSDNNVQDSAKVNGNALKNASGNIAINVAAGAQNQQENGLAIASIASPMAMGNASAPVEQVAYCNNGTTLDSRYNSTVNGNALEGASGNIGLNVATGNGNQQVNTLAIASVQP